MTLQTPSLPLNATSFLEQQMGIESIRSQLLEIYAKAKELLNQMYKKTSEIRLIGVRVDNLIEKEEQQLSLFYNNKNQTI